MSTILAIDTTSAQGSIALVVDGQPRAEHHLDAPDGFAHVLFPAIESVLHAGEAFLATIDCFAVTSGPGTFTGLRIGLAAAKGLAEANGKPCAAVSTLQILASAGTYPIRAALMDARRGQVYAAVYDAALRPISSEIVTDLHEWIVKISEDAEFIAAAELHGAIRAIRQDAVLTSPPVRLAAALGRCAELDGTQVPWADPAAVDANYVRRSDAELAWRHTSV